MGDGSGVLGSGHMGGGDVGSCGGRMWGSVPGWLLSGVAPVANRCDWRVSGLCSSCVSGLRLGLISCGEGHDGRVY